jgi:HD-like signal output (HDOD) protein
MTLDPHQLGAALRARIEPTSPVGLPSTPAILGQLLTALRRQDVSVHAAADMVSRDPVLTGLVMRTANSPLYGLPRSSRSVVHAVASLGLRELERIVVTQSVLASLSHGHAADAELEHATTCALVSRSLTRHYEPLLDPAEVWPSAMLCGVGRLVRRQLKPRQHARIESFCRTWSAPVEVAEQALGLPEHRKVGAALLLSWDMPPLVVDVCLNATARDPMEAPGSADSLTTRRLVAASSACATLATRALATPHRLLLQTRIQDLLELDEQGFVDWMGATYAMRPQVKQLLAN